jgi:hypothetical protein
MADSMHDSAERLSVAAAVEGAAAVFLLALLGITCGPKVRTAQPN